MVLESTMICVDDSDYMRNGDFNPTRIAQEQDTVNIITTAKIRSNPENNVGLLTLASSEVLTTLTTDSGKLMSKMLAVQPSGELKIMSGLRVAHLALKHRQGKNHKMRIIIFVGSPLSDVNEQEFIRLARRLKKEKVNVDIISFGESELNEKVLQQFVDALNGKDGTGSNLVVVPAGQSLTDAVMHSPILQTEDGAAMGGGGYDFGIDPNDDPELALALRVSMEEQRARQEADARSSNPEGTAEGTSREEQMLAQALALSEGGHAAAEEVVASPDFAAMSEEDQIAYAMQMSMHDNAAAAAAAEAATNIADAETQKVPESTVPKTEEAMDIDDEVPAKTDEDMKTVLQDQEYLQSVLEGLSTPSNETKPETLQAAKNIAQGSSSGPPPAKSSKLSPSKDSKSPEKDPKKKPDANAKPAKKK